MLGKELAEYCENTKCEKCEHKSSCENFVRYMSEYLPCSLLKSRNIIEDLLNRNF